MTGHSEPSIPPLTAVADQVQAVVQDCPYPIVGFVLLTGYGAAEYRSPLPVDQLKAALFKAAEAL